MTTLDDWRIMGEVIKLSPLDRASDEAKRIELRLLDISSYNLHCIARTLLQNRYEAYPKPA